MIRLLCLCLYVFCHYKSDAQVTQSPSGDLQGAKPIKVNTPYTFQQSPVGYGNLNEYPVNVHRNPILFKEERNTIWLLIDIPFSGYLTFNLAPHNIYDDYDWMLYEYVPDLKTKIQNSGIMPLRSNNSRNDKKINSQTGLKDGFVNPYELIGPGNSYSSPLSVKKGERLALIIDNIYDGGSGFDLTVSLKPVLAGLIEGVVKSKKSGEPLKAEIVLEDDSTGALITKTVSDSVTGKYVLKAPMNFPVNVTASNAKYLFVTQEIFLEKSAKEEIDFLLDSVQTGNKLIFYNIHFLANKDDILPSSNPDLTRLTSFLQSNPSWTVKIVGHTNNNVFAEPRYLQLLSFKRAVAVKTYLLKNGISESRLSCTGMGGKVPLINTKDPVVGMKNLRVEVILVRK